MVDEAGAKQEPIHLRLDASSKLMLERTASHEETTVSRFVLRNSVAAAERAVEALELIALPATGRVGFQDTLLNPMAPNEALRRAVTASASVNDSPLKIEPLGSHHHRSSFSCGEPSLDRYLRRQAPLDALQIAARVSVASGDPPEQTVGFYTMSAARFKTGNLSAEFARRLPHYPVQATIVGRLAVDRRSQGDGLGEVQLLDAVRRTTRAADIFGVFAIMVDALHDRARAHDLRCGFVPLPSHPRCLDLPLRTPAQLEPWSKYCCHGPQHQRHNRECSIKQTAISATGEIPVSLNMRGRFGIGSAPGRGLLLPVYCRKSPGRTPCS